MDFALSDDQRAIQEAARDFLTDAANPDVIRAAVEGTTGFDESLWSSFAEMGFAGLMIPEGFGGLGLDDRFFLLHVSVDHNIQPLKK